MRNCHYCKVELNDIRPGQPPTCPDTGRDVCAGCYTSEKHKAAIARQSHGTIPAAGGQVGKPSSDAAW